MTGQEQVTAALKRYRAEAERLWDLPKLQESVHLMKIELKELVEERQQPEIEAPNVPKTIVVSDFQVREFLVHRMQKKPNQNPSFTLYGAGRVVAVKGPVLCVIQFLLTNKNETMDVARIRK